MRIGHFLPLFIIWSFPNWLFAQVPDTSKVKVNHPVAGYFQEKDFSPDHIQYTTLDTFTEAVQKYFPNNFTYSLGLAGRRLFHSPSTEIGFRSGFNNLDLFGYNKEAIKYYKARTPYTEVSALFGNEERTVFQTSAHTKYFETMEYRP